MKPAAEILRRAGADRRRCGCCRRTARPSRRRRSCATRPRGGTKVFICGAGGAAHLAGAVAAHTTRPVIGVPIASGSLQGFDSLLSTVQMPPGMPVATVAVGGAENAGLLAAQIIALGDRGAGQPGRGRARGPPRRRSWRATPRCAPSASAADVREERPCRPSSSTRSWVRRRRARARRDRRVPDRDLLRAGGRRARRRRAGAAARAQGAGARRRSRCWSTGPTWSTRCAGGPAAGAGADGAHWPGPLTLALPARPRLPAALVAEGCVAVR